MSQSFSMGDAVKVFNIKTDECYGEFTFLKIENNILFVQSANGLVQHGDLPLLRLEPVNCECQHEWKRLDLFRTTEFHCTKCPAMRPFDKEKDEAA